MTMGLIAEVSQAMSKLTSVTGLSQYATQTKAVSEWSACRETQCRRDKIGSSLLSRCELCYADTCDRRGIVDGN